MTAGDSLHPETAIQRLSGRLRQWQRRRRLAEAVIWLPRGLLAGLLAAVALAAAARFHPLLANEELGYAAGVLALGGLLLTTAYLLLQRPGLAKQARLADHHFGLQERVATALEIHQGRLTVPASLAALQLADTLRAAERVDPRAALPLRPARQDWIMILAATLLLAAAVWLPNPQADILRQQRVLAQTIAEQVAALEALEEQVQQNPALSEAQREELLEPIQGALEELQPGGLSQEEVVAVLSEAEADLRDLNASNSTEALRQTLQQAGQPLAENPTAQSLGQALQNGDLAQAGAAAAQLADNLPGLTAEEQAALANDLMETAAALQQVDPELAQELAQAAQALQNGDVAAAQQALREAAATLQQRDQQQAAAQQAAAAAGQLGQGRQEVAQASQQGQGQSQGEGQGEGQAQGEGQGDGQGQGQGEGQGQLDGQGEGAGGPGPGGGHSENVFVPDFADLSGQEGVDLELPADCLANPNACGALLNQTPSEFGDESSLVPYSQVYGDYRDAAYEALADDYIPLGLKGYIRDYFSSLEP